MKNTETDISGALKRVKAALAGLRIKADDLDSQINEINRKISHLRQSPISLDDFRVFLRESVVRIGESWIGLPASRSFIVDEYLGQPSKFHQRPWEEFENTTFFNHNVLRRLLSSEGSNAMICALFPDQVCTAILEKIKKDVGAIWGNEDAVPVTERRVIIASLEKERVGLEAQRSALQQEIDTMVEVIT